MTPKVESIETRQDEVLLRAYSRSVRYRAAVTVRGSDLAVLIDQGLMWRDRAYRAERDLDSIRFTPSATALKGNYPQ